METRCMHYHTENDRIAIKFYCCQSYYSCYACHDELGCGEQSVWPRNNFDEPAILCGGCKRELTINDYLQNNNKCQLCEALFNPGCSLHGHLYFDV